MFFIKSTVAFMLVMLYVYLLAWGAEIIEEKTDSMNAGLLFVVVALFFTLIGGIQILIWTH